jgi:hypothetical protein
MIIFPITFQIHLMQLKILFVAPSKIRKIGGRSRRITIWGWPWAKSMETLSKNKLKQKCWRHSNPSIAFRKEEGGNSHLLKEWTLKPSSIRQESFCTFRILEKWVQSILVTHRFWICEFAHLCHLCGHSRTWQSCENSGSLNQGFPSWGWARCYLSSFKFQTVKVSFVAYWLPCFLHFVLFFGDSTV